MEASGQTAVANTFRQVGDTLKAQWSKIIFTGRGQPPRQASSSSEAKKIIAENPNAIGDIDGSAVDGSVRVLPSR